MFILAFFFCLVKLKTSFVIRVLEPLVLRVHSLVVEWTAPARQMGVRFLLGPSHIFFKILISSKEIEEPLNFVAYKRASRTFLPLISIRPFLYAM